MENQPKKQKIYSIMRALHRDIGFLTVGLTIVYALSGLLLIYRNTDFMKIARTEQLQLDKGLAAEELGGQLRLRGFKVTHREGALIHFAEGTYNAETGAAVVERKVYIAPFDKLVNLHKVTGRSKVSPFAAVYAAMLCFLAISSLFMFKFGSKKSNRGLIIVAGGIAITVALVLLL